jgi:BirA family biotin operon repressor/biotin-[acetyl-CoA-carboxylase] ligase
MKNRIQNTLYTDYIGRNLHFYESIDSTNIRAKEIALEAPEGTVIIAEEQTEGIGRLGRTWLSPKGKGIWMSIILKPQVEPENVSKITLLGAAAVNLALYQMAIVSKIKWPNDIIIDEKKVGGILTEMSMESHRVNYVVMGIGINVNLDQDEFPEELENKATSLKIAVKKYVDKDILVSYILNHFEELYEEFKTGSISKTVEICRMNSVLLGKEVQIIKGKETRIGQALDINSEGELLVQFKDGVIENIFSGEVSLRGLEGYI